MNDTEVKVIEYNILISNTIGNKIIFNKDLATMLILKNLLAIR